MANLLQKASIVLTPTAYNDGEVLCAKPDDGSGDFDFSRNSAATRVNAQGLVENVQILSSNLVQNGDFSEEGVQEVSNGSFSQIGPEEVSNGSFSQDGSEVVVNGDFAFNSNWSGTNTIANGQLTKGSGGGLVYQGTLDGTIKTYKVTINVAEKNGLSLNLYLGGNQFSLNEGVQTLYVQSGNSNTFIGFNNGADSIINSISCVEVGQDWVIENTWTIGDGVANGNGANGSFEELTQANVTTVGKTYKVTYDILNYVSGSVAVGSGDLQSGNGTITEYWEAISTNFKIRGNGFFNGSVTNISVKEIPDWTLGTGWSIGEDKANGDGSGTAYSIALQSTPISAISGNTVKLEYTISNYVSGSIRPTLGIVNGLERNSNGTFIEYIKLGSNAPALQLVNRATALNGSITNISVKEVGQNWELQPNASIGENKIICDNVSANTNIAAQGSLVPFSKSVKLQYDIVVNSGTFRVLLGSGGTSTQVTTSGTYTFYETSGTGGSLTLQARSGGFDGSITNISLVEVIDATNIPRIDYSTGEGVILLEPQSTNLVTYSEDFSGWSHTNSTDTPSQGVSPDGNNTMSLITYSSVGGSLYKVMPTISGNTYTFSIYMATQSGTIDIRVGNIDAGVYEVKTITTTPTRVSVTQVASANNRLLAIESLGIYSVLVWGAQVEALPYATSYIPTSGAIATRLADVVTGAGDATTFNSTEGVLYFEGERLSLLGSKRTISISDGTLNNYLQIQFQGVSNTVKIFHKTVENGLVFNASHALTNPIQFNKYAFKWSDANFSLWINGVKEIEQLSGGTTSSNVFNQADFSLSNGADEFTGKVKSLITFNTALTDAELECLTTI